MPKSIVFNMGEGKAGKVVTFDPHNGLPRRQQRQHQEEPDLDDDESTPPSKPRKQQNQIEMEEVEIGGKKFYVQKGAGDALKAQSKPKQTDEQRLRAMFEEFMGTQTKPKKKQVRDEPDDEDDEDAELDALMFTDPAKYRKIMREQLRKDILKEVRSEYSADQGQKTFWRDFYDENDDLKEYDFIVRSTLQENMSDLKDMQTAEAAKKLAELSRDKLLKIAKKMGKGRRGSDESEHVEGGAPARRGRDSLPQELEDQDVADKKAGMPLTLGGMLKLRREERRKPSKFEAAEE